MNKKKQTKNMLMDMTIEEQLLKIQEAAPMAGGKTAKQSIAR